MDRLKKLNDNKDWRSILGIKDPDKNQKDLEIILRLFSLFEVHSKYEKPMLRYLNSQMNENRNFDSLRAKRFEKIFPKVTALVANNLERPFRPRSVINAAMLDGVMIALLENPEVSPKHLKEGYRKLLANSEFEKLLRGATTDTLTVRERIKKAKAAFSNG